MRWIIAITIFLTCACGKTHAQVNYVLNPSFEQYNQCPYSADQIYFANYWSALDTSGQPFPNAPLCSGEYLNVCGSSVGAVPSNNYYYNIYPHTGNGMIENLMYVDINVTIPVKRDYSEGRLYTHLVAGQSYCITFYVALEQQSQYGINHIGAYLDNGTIDIGQDSVGCAQPQTNFTPQVYATDVINDTGSWQKIEGSFTAIGTERFITIGNFFDMAHTTAVDNGYSATGTAYYLVDDISVIASNTHAYAGHDTTIAIGDSAFIGRTDLMPDIKWHVLGNSTIIDSTAGFWVKPTAPTTYIVQQTLCGITTYDTVTVAAYPAGVSNVRYDKGFIIYPNPANGDFTVKNLTTEKNMQLTITDVSGRVVYKQAISATDANVHASLSQGIYMAELGNGEVKYIKKIVITK